MKWLQLFMNENIFSDYFEKVLFAAICKRVASFPPLTLQPLIIKRAPPYRISCLEQWHGKKSTCPAQSSHPITHFGSSFSQVYSPKNAEEFQQSHKIWTTEAIRDVERNFRKQDDGFLFLCSHHRHFCPK